MHSLHKELKPKELKFTEADKLHESLYSIQEIHQVLKRHGARLTPQREYILDVFFKADQGFHLSVEDIHKLLNRSSNLNVSLATVYRTVKTLYSMGILREVDLAEGHKHYELASNQDNHHHHIVCLNCNKTIEFYDEEVNKLAQEIAKKYNVEIQDLELKIYGKCLDFEGQEDNHEHRR
ncbi:MAG: transcriptional repressor [Candidatus Caenarcaniphilales bacterium]|nr:transcriptional repressor [Candidatus Caenarcaniphilales bacterium]